MTAHRLLAVACLAAAAVVVAWPQRGREARLLATSHPALRGLRARVAALPARHLIALVVALAALAGTLLAGPVAGAVAGGYGAIVVRAVLRQRADRDGAAMRTRSLDALCGLAADLRAGLSTSRIGIGPAAGSVPGDPVAVVEDRRMAELTGAAWHLAERTGAPIADLVERIEADARAMDRATAAAAAQAAGARATAWLLAALPVAGIGLGYAIGVDPLQVLLHTPIGAACAAGAIVLQVAGLAWADRLAAAGTTRPEPVRPAPAPLWTVTAGPASVGSGA